MAGYPKEASLFLEALASRINATPVIPPSPGATSILEFAKLMNPYFETPRHVQEIGKYLEAAERGDIKRLMIMTAPQHGKQIADSEPVLTSNGYKKHGDLCIGDMVFSPSGKQIKVLAVGEPSNEKLEIEFMNGEKIKVHPNHEWTVFDRGGRHELKTVDTKYMASRSLFNGHSTFAVPNISPLEYAHVELPIDPYTLGAWLGDGTSSAPVICGSKSDLDHIIDRIPYELGARWIHKTTGVHYQNIKGGLPQLLRKNVLMNNKHIPEQYFHSHIEQRRELLRGIVDTDGHVDKHGQVHISCGMRVLAYDILRLVRSLGYRAMVNLAKLVDRGRKIKDKVQIYRIEYTPHDGFGQGTLNRKYNPRYFIPRKLGIRAIRKCPDEPGRCIQVDSEDGLYLVGEALIPTHNSLMVSQMFPSWAMGRNPRRKFILASYGVERAVPNSRKARDNIVHPLFPFPDCKLSMKSQAVDQWETEAGGSCLAAGVGGRITGFGADFLLIDDPVKGQDEADSPLMRDKTWEWYTRDARSRLAPNAAIIVIMTRWNEDDMAGRLIAQGGWTVLNMPAMAEENDVLGRKPGEYLWTDHYSIQDYVDTEREVGPKAWDSLYQQRPSTAGGGIFQNGWWREYSIAKLADMGLRPALITVDSAFKDGVQNDYSVAAVWGHMNGAAYLIDIWRDRATFPVLVEKMRSLYKRYRAPIVIEDAASGQSLVQVLSQPLPDQPAIPVVAYKLRKGTSKISRAESVTRYIEQGLVYLPDHAMWKDEFVREHCLAAGTKILTIDGIKNIEDITVGDMVLTHNGRYQPVINTQSLTDDVHIISGKTLSPIMITKNHKVLASSGDGSMTGWVESGDLISRKPTGEKTYEAKHHRLTVPRFNLLENGSVIDMAKFPNSCKARHIEIGNDFITPSNTKVRPIKRFVNADYRFGRLCGLYIAEGSCTKSAAAFSLNGSTEEHLLSEVENSLHDIFGAKTARHSYKNNKAVSVVTVSSLLDGFFKSFGTGAKNKVVPSWAWGLGPDFTSGLIDGWADGDGYDNGSMISVTSVSESLVWQMRVLAAGLGISASVRCAYRTGPARIMGLDCVQQDAYTLSWVKSGYGAGIILNTVISYAVTHNETDYANETVYDIEVLEDSSFFTTGGIVHNSQFPHGKFDDQVDTTSIALARIFNTAERRDPTDYYYNKPHEARGNRIITKFRDARRAAQAAKLEKILV